MRYALALLSLLPLALVACDDDVPPECPGYTLNDTALSVNLTPTDVSCIQPAYASSVDADTAFIQFIDFADDLRLVVFFPDYNPDAPASSFPIQSEITKAAVERIPAGGGDWEVVCNTVVEGSELEIRGFSVDPTQVLEDGGPNPFTWFSAFEGTLDLTIAGCTVPEWGVSGQTAQFTGELVWSAD